VKYLPTILSADEVDALLAELAGQHQQVIAAALYTAMRKGEVGGLLRTDVDLPAGVIRLQRCWDGPGTKDGKPLLVPIVKSLRPYLHAALDASGSAYVFPAPDRRMHRPDVKWDVTLRRALGRAGIVVGYEHRCRRHGCGYSHIEASSEPGRCPKPSRAGGKACGFQLYARPVPKHVRFHDLRHSTATLLLREGVAPPVVSKLLRHSDPKITLGICGHLDVEDLREGLERLPFGKGHEVGPAGAQTEVPGVDGAPVARTTETWESEGPEAVAFARTSGPSNGRGDWI